MDCPYCDNPLPPDVPQCPSCGAPVRQQPQQQYAPPPQQYYQPPPQQQQQYYQPPQQQYYQQPPPQYAPPPQQQYYQAPPVSLKSRVVYIVLGIVFGWFCGAHNFYAGRKVQGLLQLLLFLFAVSCSGWNPELGPVCVFVLWGWVFVNIVAVTTDGQGRRFN